MRAKRTPQDEWTSVDAFLACFNGHPSDSHTVGNAQPHVSSTKRVNSQTKGSAVYTQYDSGRWFVKLGGFY